MPDWETRATTPGSRFGPGTVTAGSGCPSFIKQRSQHTEARAHSVRPKSSRINAHAWLTRCVVEHSVCAFGCCQLISRRALPPGQGRISGFQLPPNRSLWVPADVYETSARVRRSEFFVEVVGEEF